MKIKQFELKRTFNGGDFNSFTVGYVAELEKEDKLEDVKKDLTFQINQDFVKANNIGTNVKVRYVINDPENFKFEQVVWAVTKVLENTKSFSEKEVNVAKQLSAKFNA